MKVNAVLFTAYVVVAVLTFGHSAAQVHAACLERNPTHMDGVCGIEASVFAFIYAPLWPLYWSWEYYDAR